MKKVILPTIAGLILCFFESSAFADFYVGAGRPFLYSFSGENSDGRKFTVDNTTGIMLHIQFPGRYGLGMETYEVKLKDPDFVRGELSVVTTMIDLFYTFPIPGVLISLGLGYGLTEFACSVCGDYFNDDGSRQLYSQLGIPLGFMEIHLSYHQIFSKITSKVTSYEADLTGNMVVLGFGFSF